MTFNAIGLRARACLALSCAALSAGLACFAAVTDAGCIPQPMIVGDRKPRDFPKFLFVGTLLGNLEPKLARAHRLLKYRNYAAGIVYRFNQRFDLHGPMARLIVDVARCAPAKERVIRQPAGAGF